MMRDIQHFVFDIGRVLIHYDPDIAFQTIIPDHEKRRWFFENVCTSEWNIEQDRGRTWQDAEAMLIDQFPDWRGEIKAFRQNWSKMVPHSYAKSVGVLERLLAMDTDVTLLTNFASDTFREAQSLYPFLAKTRGVTVSGDIKLIKPDPEIFHYHMICFDLDPAKTYFIDDSQANVDAANALGWHAELFTTEEKFVSDFSKFMPQT